MRQLGWIEDCNNGFYGPVLLVVDFVCMLILGVALKLGHWRINIVVLILNTLKMHISIFGNNQFNEDEDKSLESTLMGLM